MNLRDLMNKLDIIAETPGAFDPQRAAYDKYKADDAKKAAIDQVKSMTKPNGARNYIDPKDGIIKYMDSPSGRGGGEGSVKEYSYDWFKSGQNPEFFNVLKAAGLEVIPVEKKQLFGTAQVAGVDLKKLATLGQEAQAQADATSNKTNTDAVNKLNDLAYQLSQLKGKGAKGSGSPMAGVNAGKPGENNMARAGAAASPTIDQTNNSVLQAIGKGVNAQGQNTTITNADGSTTNSETGVTTPAAAKGRAAGGYGFGMKAEGIEFQSNIAKNLVESFGYSEEALMEKGFWSSLFGRGERETGQAVAGSAERQAAGSAERQAAASPSTSVAVREPASTAVSTDVRQVARPDNVIDAEWRMIPPAQQSKVAEWLKANKGKTLAAALVALGLGNLALNRSNTVTPVGQPEVDPVPAPAPAPAPAPVSPEDNGVTPEQQAIIDQMLEIMKGLEGDTDPQTVAAITNAQERISAVKGSKEQAAMDAQVAADARDAAAKSPYQKAPAVGGAGQPDTAPAPAEPKYGLTDREGRPIGTGTPGQYWNTQNESSDELARWLKIARGR